MNIPYWLKGFQRAEKSASARNKSLLRRVRRAERQYCGEKRAYVACGILLAGGGLAGILAGTWQTMIERDVAGIVWIALGVAAVPFGVLLLREWRVMPQELRWTRLARRQMQPIDLEKPQTLRDLDDF